MGVEPGPRLAVAENAEAAARLAAQTIADNVRRAIDARGRAAVALSGGRTPRRMLELLASEDLPWERIDFFQVDERVAPTGDPDRNSVCVAAAFERIVAAHPERFHWMPVESGDLASAARQYSATLHSLLPASAALDVVHLGIGGDGHTASLFPGSPLLDETQRDVAMAASHQGRERMTLTFGMLNRAHSIVWLVTGSDKQSVLARLMKADAGLVASRVRRDVAVVVADAAAARSAVR